MKELIENTIDDKAVAAYYTAEWGEWLGVYADGTWHVGASVGQEIDPVERPIALVKCPGIGNIEVEWTEEELMKGTVDVVPETDDLIEKLLDSIEEE